MIEKLKWITWSIMPLVYDESLSYVELLDKVIAKLNEVIEATNNFTKPVQETIDAWLKSDEGQAAVEQSVGDFIVAYSKTPSFQQVLVSALENQSAEIKTAASEAAETYLKSPEGKTALDTEIRDYMLVYTKTDEFKNLIGEYVMELNDILRGEKLDIRQKNSTTIQTPNTVISSAEIANDYSAGSAKSRVEVNSNGVHIYSDEDMSTPAISAGGGVVELGKNLDAKTHRIINLPTPEAAHEAANKFYVDNAISSIPGGGGGGGGGAGVITVDVERNSQGIWRASKTFLEIARNLNYGNVVKAVIRDGREPNVLTCSSYRNEIKFTGVTAIAWPEVTITGRNKPSRYYITTVTISNNDQVKVDETEWNSANFIQTDGSMQFTNAQSMGNNQLRDLAAPTKDTDAATKGYVDSHGGGGSGGGGGGVSLGEIRLTDLDDAASGVISGYKYEEDSYEFYLENDEDNSKNLTGDNLEIFNQLKEACDTFSHIDLGNKPVNATITFYIKFPTDTTANRWAVNVSKYQWEPQGGGAELGMVLFGHSTARDKIPFILTEPLTYHEITFYLAKYYDNSTSKWNYQFEAYLSNADSRLLNSWGVTIVENVHRDWPTGAMYVVDGYPAKIDSSYVLNGAIPSVLLVNTQINEGGTKMHRSCIAAHGCNIGEYNSEGDEQKRNIKFIADYPALNNPNVTFRTTFSGAGNVLALPLTVKTTASGVPDVIDGSITVGDDGTISALTLNGINKTLISGIWSWKDKWDCSSELSLTYLTVGEKNFKYTFKLTRAYKVDPNNATDTMYGLDFECDNGDYKMVITQTFNTASETVPAATYKTVKYGGNDSGGGGSSESEYGVQIVDFDASGITLQNDKTDVNSIVINGVSKSLNMAGIALRKTERFTTAVITNTSTHTKYFGTLISASSSSWVFDFAGLTANSKRYAKIDVTNNNLIWSLSN